MILDEGDLFAFDENVGEDVLEGEPGGDEFAGRENDEKGNEKVEEGDETEFGEVEVIYKRGRHSAIDLEERRT